jgi:FlaA1/EpsC-like NDP-sugar epimerase
LRPGEKLYEELLIGDNVRGTSHPRIMQASEKYLPWAELQQLLDGLGKNLSTSNVEEIKQTLTTLVDGYQPWPDKKEKTEDTLVQHNTQGNVVHLPRK